MKHNQSLLAKARLKYQSVAIAVLLATVGNNAYAGNTLSTWLSWIKENVIKPFIEFLMYLGYAGGLLLVVIAIYQWVEAGKPNSHTTPKVGLVYFVCGAALMVVGYLADMGAASMAMGSSTGTWRPAN